MSHSLIGVVGAGVMGTGVAQNLAQTGHRVVLIDVTDEKLSEANERVDALAQKLEQSEAARKKAELAASNMRRAGGDTPMKTVTMHRMMLVVAALVLVTVGVWARGLYVRQDAFALLEFHERGVDGIASPFSPTVKDRRLMDRYRAEWAQETQVWPGWR